MLISLVVYCLLGAIAGVLAGLLGVGGGIVIVPMLVFAFGWQNFPQDVLMLMALGTSMGSIMFTSISSSLAHSRNKGVQWDAVRNITPGILIGTFCGSFLASHVPARFLQLFFVAFLFFVITQMLSGKKPKPSRHLPGLGGMSVAGGIIGVVSSLVGIGGGTLSVPFLLWNNLDMRKAIGTSGGHRLSHRPCRMLRLHRERLERREPAALFLRLHLPSEPVRHRHRQHVHRSAGCAPRPDPSGPQT